MGVNTPVRIAGVNVGKVSKVEKADDDSTASVVTMKLNDEALPIKEDAAAQDPAADLLRRQLLRRPQARLARREGARLRATRSRPPRPARRCSSTRCSAACERTPARISRSCWWATARRSRASPPRARTTTRIPTPRARPRASPSTTRSSTHPTALRGSAVVNQATLGSELHDLSKLVAGGQKVSAALASRETQLKDLISNFNTTTGALAAEQANLRQDDPAAARGAGCGQPRLRRLNASFPPTRAFAREIIPGVRETPGHYQGIAAVDRAGPQALLAC